MQELAGSALAATYFDGTSARAQPVTLELRDGVLRVSGDGVDRLLAPGDVFWPERTRHGKRVAHLKGGGSVQSADAAAWDAWSRAAGRAEPLVVQLQQSWRWVLASVVLLVAIAVALYRWGLPVLSSAVVAATPLSVDHALGEVSLAALDEHLMRPSKLPAPEQARLRAALAQATGALPRGSVPAWQLVFRQSRIGPNALALPGGTLVMTDELVELVGRDEQVLTGVLAHELGHVRHRHGLRMLVQVTVLGALSSVVLGDFSTVLAAAPVLLGQAAYSREAEREADAEALRLLQAARISPGVMVTLFDRLDQARRDKTGSGAADNKPDGWLGIGFSSHPPDAERLRYFKEAAARP